MGITIGEYIRNMRLSLAAQEIYLWVYDFYDVPTEHAAYAVYSSPNFYGNYFDAAYEFTRDQILGDNVHIPYPQSYWTAEVYLEGFFTGSGAHRFGYLFSVEL